MNMSPYNLLWWIAFPTIIALGFGISFLMTYFDCYAQDCVEDFLPTEVRIHLAMFYGWLFLTSLFLLTTRASNKWSRWFNTHVRISKDYHPSRGEILFWIWLLLLLGAVPAVWWRPQFAFFNSKAEGLPEQAIIMLNLTGLTGHWCDILLGLVLLSVGRTSPLAYLFNLTVEVTLYFHRIISYMLFGVTLLHMVVFYTWLVLSRTFLPEEFRHLFDVDNPYLEAEKLSYWQAALLGSGLAGTILLTVLIITSLPSIRLKKYNSFYFTHFLFIPFLFLVCVHASTDFYLALPGLLTWIVDGILRLNYVNPTHDAELVCETGDYYTIKLDKPPARPVDGPLFYYYINIPSISKRELHPFTTPSNHAEVTQGKNLMFLIRPVTKPIKEGKKIEWTQSIAKKVTEVGKPTAIRIHLEGPFATPTPPLRKFDLILCIVGGTGITGALGLAHGVLNLAETHTEVEAQRRTKCVIVWNFREPQKDVEQLQCMQSVRQHMNKVNNGDKIVEFVMHNTRENGRLNFTSIIEEQLKTHPRAYIYTSGPVAMMSAVAEVCRQKEKEFKYLEWHEAKWDS